jgi:hypothetical protein
MKTLKSKTLEPYKKYEESHPTQISEESILSERDDLESADAVIDEPDPAKQTQTIYASSINIPRLDNSTEE